MKHLEKQLKEAIMHGADSGIVKPKMINEDSIYRDSPAWPDLHTLKEKKEMKKINGAEFENGKLVLYPVNPIKESIIVGSDKGILYHRGMLFIHNRTNNLTNLKEDGVFGNPDEKMETYLMRCGGFVNTFGTMKGRKSIRLWVDTEKLIAKRNIFLDPYVISDNYFHERLGDSYFVLGGIPRESIIDFALEE